MNLSIKFGVNSKNIPRVMNNFTYKTNLNFCHAYRLDWLEEQVEHQYVARFKITGVPSGG